MQHKFKNTGSQFIVIALSMVLVLPIVLHTAHYFSHHHHAPLKCKAKNEMHFHEGSPTCKIDDYILKESLDIAPQVFAQKHVFTIYVSEKYFQHLIPRILSSSLNKRGPPFFS